MNKHDTPADPSMVEHDLRIRFLEDWRTETAPVIKDIITVQAKQSANIANITRLFWLVFAVTIVKMIAGLFL
jgi:hypothetical protein